MGTRTPRNKNKARLPNKKREAKKSRQNKNSSVTNQVTPSKPKKKEVNNSMELDIEEEVKVTKVVQPQKETNEDSEDLDNERQSGVVEADKNIQ